MEFTCVIRNLKPGLGFDFLTKRDDSGRDCQDGRFFGFSRFKEFRDPRQTACDITRFGAFLRDSREYLADTNTCPHIHHD